MFTACRLLIEIPCRDYRKSIGIALLPEKRGIPPVLAFFAFNSM
jgi:hypothetical protein